LATAKFFVKEGAYVFITGRRPNELDEAVKAIGTNVSGVQGDVAKLADLDRLYETVAKVKGRSPPTLPGQILPWMALMDEVRFEEGGIVVHMRKRIGQAAIKDAQKSSPE